MRKAILGLVYRFADRQRRHLRQAPRPLGSQRSGTDRPIPTAANAAIRRPAGQIHDRRRGQNRQQAVEGPTRPGGRAAEPKFGSHRPTQDPRLPLHEPGKIDRSLHGLPEIVGRHIVRFLGDQGGFEIEVADIMLPCHGHKSCQNRTAPDRRAVTDLPQPHHPHQHQAQAAAGQ